MNARVLVACMALGVLVSTPARAQDPADLPAVSPPTDAMQAGTDQHRPYWRGSGPVRPFVASIMEVGIVYVRPWLQVGYGRPHYEWFGAEVYQSLSLTGGRSYAGVRATWPFIDVRAGARYEYPTDFYFSPLKDSYDREELENRVFGREHYMAGEAEITGTIPVPRGSIVLVATGYALLGIPDDRAIFENALKVVTDPPWLWRGRLGYLFHFGWEGSMRLGLAGEVIHLIGREDVVVRAGPLFSVSLTHHLETQAAIMVVAYSPDELGLIGADVGQLGLRYRWATGDRFPEIP